MSIFQELVQALRSSELPRLERGLLFGQLLGATGGEWSSGDNDDSTFAEFVYATAQRQVRRQRHRASEARLDAQDIAQIVLMRFTDALPKITITAEHWVVAATKFEIRRALKSSGVMGRAGSIEAESERGIEHAAPPDPEPWTPEEVAAADQVAQKVTAAVQRLTPALRAVSELKLFRDPGMTLVEVGARLQISADTARQRWCRARRILRKQLLDIDVALFLRERRLTPLS